MRHVNSNLNILKEKRYSENIKINTFLKPPSIPNNFNSPMTTKNANNKNTLYSLLYKYNSKKSLYNTKNTTNTYTYKNISELTSGGGNKNNSSKKNINLFNNSLSIGNSICVKEKKVKVNHISIRLKLNNKIISNNINTKYKSKKKKVNNDMVEKIKEKDLKINKLQKELLQSQELLNKLQKDKQKELNFTFNSIKSLENLNNISKDYLVNDFIINTLEKNDITCKVNFNKIEKNKIKNKNKKNNNSKTNRKNYSITNTKNIKSLLKIDSLINININYNYKNKRSHKNLNKNNNTNKNNLIDIYKNHKPINKTKYNLPKSNNLRSFSSSANRFFPRCHLPYYSYISLDKNAIHRKDKKIINEDNNNKNKLLSSKNNIKKNNSNLNNLIMRCNLLKEKAYNILSNYISLTEYIINNKKESK